MTSSQKLKTIALAAIAAAFVVIPATASAHPSVYTDTAKAVPTGWAYAGPGFAGLDTQTRYSLSNHGYPMVLRETNGVTNAGVMDYSLIPSAYRTALKADQGIAAVLSEAASGAQAHATCTAAALNTTSAITGWQGTDPFYAYIPFQGTSAGLEDDPATWIDDVLALTAGPNAVDLSTITDTTYAEDGPLDTACEALGGNLVPPDVTQTTGASWSSALLADATAPLNTQITTLTDEKTALEADKTALQGQVATLASEKQTLSGTVATMTGAKDALAAENAKLKADLAKSTTAKAKAQKQIKSLKKQVAKLKKKLK